MKPAFLWSEPVLGGTCRCTLGLCPNHQFPGAYDGAKRFGFQQGAVKEQSELCDGTRTQLKAQYSAVYFHRRSRTLSFHGPFLIGYRFR